MSAIFIHQGDAIDHVPDSDLGPGAVVVLADMVGITTRTVAAGHLGALQLRGVFDMPKATGADTGIAKGQRVFWHPANQVVTTDPTDAVALGHAVRPATDDDAVVRVRLVAA